MALTAQAKPAPRLRRAPGATHFGVRRPHVVSHLRDPGTSILLSPPLPQAPNLLTGLDAVALAASNDYSPVYDSDVVPVIDVLRCVKAAIRRPSFEAEPRGAGHP